MDQTAWGYSEPVLFNGQHGDNLQTISGTFEDWRGLNWTQPIAENDPGQAADLANAHPLFSGFVQPCGASLPLSLAYTDSEQSPGTSLPCPANYADVQGHVQPRGTGVPRSPAYTDSAQSTDASLLLSSVNKSYFPGSASTQYQAHANALSLPQPQANRGDIFPGISLNYTLLRPQYPACGGYQCPNGNQSYEQSIFWLEHQSAYQSGLDDNSNYVPLLDTDYALANFDSRPCPRCQLQKKKCRKDTFDRQSRCSGCVKQGIPASICSLVITWITPFDKCLDTKHQFRNTSIQSNGFSFSKTVQLGHYPKGPTLTVECCQFRATDIIQTTILRKNQHNIYTMITPSWCLKYPKIDISTYLQECVEFAMVEACKRQHPKLSFFFNLACIYKNVPIMRFCWKEFTALRLLRLWWDFAGNECLGIELIKDRESPFYGFRPIPRMLRDQLNHALELEMMDLDAKILSGLQSILENKEPHMWVIGILVLFFLLHIREVYAGQHLIWKDSYIELVDLWNHRSSPAAIIDKVVASCNCLLSFFHFSRGPKLLHLDWDNDKSGNEANIPLFVESMKMIQGRARKLKTDGWIGQKARDVFKAGNPNSVEFTVCSLIFESTEKGCEVKGFY